MRICICDDDKCIHLLLKDNISSFFCGKNMPEIIQCYSGAETLGYFENDAADIIFLDIELGDENGIDIAMNIRKKDKNAIIIFISSHPQYVFDAFKCEAFHFLVKPITSTDFEDVFSRAMHKYRTENDNIALGWNHTRSNIKIGDILYIEGYKRKLDIHTKHGTFSIIGKISDAYSHLKDFDFILVHQGYIVNMKYIENFKNGEITLYNGEVVMVSVRKRAEAIMVYDKYIQKWKW